MDNDIYMTIKVEGYRKGQIYSPLSSGHGGLTQAAYDAITTRLGDTLKQLGLEVQGAVKTK